MQGHRSLLTPHGFDNVLIIVRCTAVDCGTGCFAEQSTLLIFNNNGGETAAIKSQHLDFIKCEHRFATSAGDGLEELTQIGQINNVSTPSRVPDA